MIALGIDPSSRKIATVSLGEDGQITTRLLPVADERGARRLAFIRSALGVQLSQFKDVAVIVVEVPWANPKMGSSFVLLSTAGVIMETAQAVHPGAVVLDVPTSSWKLDSVGKGNASKAEVLEHAQARGLDGDDQDLADALCMAECGWYRWMKAAA